MEANLESTERTSGTFLMLKKYQITRQINVNCLMHVKNDKRVCTLLSFLISMTFHDFFEELSQFCMALVLADIFENYTLLVFEIILLQTQTLVSPKRVLFAVLNYLSLPYSTLPLL